MDKNLMNISRIEAFFDSILKGKLSKNIFYSDLPPTIKESWSDFVLVDVFSVNDLDGMGTGLVNIYLYAKPLSSGCKNVKALNNLEDKLTAILKDAEGKPYNITRAYTNTGFDSQCNTHYNIVGLYIKIF